MSAMKRPPTKAAVVAKIKEYQRIGKAAFLAKYSNNRPAIAWYIIYDDEPYDMKAVWAAAHLPAVKASAFNTSEPHALLPELGFEIISSAQEKLFSEGKRELKERSYFQRHPQLVKAAKKYYGCKCMICTFDFFQAYGEIGEDFIECHHIVPMAKDEERDKTVEDVAVVCSNCHRMIHRGGKCRSIDEMKALVHLFRSHQPGTIIQPH